MSYYRAPNAQKKPSTAATALREQIRNGGTLGMSGPLSGSTSPVMAQNRPSSAPAINRGRAAGPQPSLLRGALVSASTPSFQPSAYTAQTSEAGLGGGLGGLGNSRPLPQRSTAALAPTPNPQASLAHSLLTPVAGRN